MIMRAYGCHIRKIERSMFDSCGAWSNLTLNGKVEQLQPSKGMITRLRPPSDEGLNHLNASHLYLRGPG